MRTTLVLDDALFKRAKRRAAELGITVSDLVNEALRGALAPKPQESPAPPFSMVTYGRGGPPSRHEPADFAKALEEEDRKLR